MIISAAVSIGSIAFVCTIQVYTFACLGHRHGLHLIIVNVLLQVHFREPFQGRTYELILGGGGVKEDGYAPNVRAGSGA